MNEPLVDVVIKALKFSLALSLPILANGAVSVRLVESADCKADFILAQAVCESEICPTEEPRRILLSGSRATVVLGDGIWRFTAPSPGCWSAATEYRASDDVTSEISIRLFPAASVVGNLSGTGALGDNTVHAQVRLGETENPVSVRETKIACEVEAGRFRCSVPATQFDLQLESPGFAPKYLFDLAPQAGATTEIGTYTLSRGASISGWIQSPRQSRTPRDVTIALSNDSEGKLTKGQERSLRVSETRANHRGFFQFINVPEGKYRLRATAPEFSPSPYEVLDVREGREYNLAHALELEPLAELEVWLNTSSLPSDSWHIKLSRVDEIRGLLTLVRAGPVQQGRWISGPIEAGAHVLEVRDAKGSIHFRDDVKVFSSMPVLHVALTSVPIVGTVRVGDEYFTGRLEFSNATRKAAQFETDDDGRFFGVLPEEGVWRVDVTQRESRSRTKAGQVNVKRRTGEDSARVDIELPDGRVAGEVQNASGTPVPAVVHLFRDGKSAASQLTGADGKFNLFGLQPGRVQLQAVGKDGATSEMMPLLISETVEGLMLTVRKLREIRVRLRDDRGLPVVGAVVRHISPRLSSIEDVTTGPSGAFKLVVPESVKHVDVAIVAPGFPKKIAAIESTSPPNREVELILRRSAGLLVLSGLSNGQLPYISSEDGHLVPLALLLSTRGNSLPRELETGDFKAEFEAGRYLICKGPLPSSKCQITEIHAGSRQVLDLGNFD